MKEKLKKVSAYLTKEELRQFNLSVMARGAGQSGYIREMLGFDIRPRGAPKGPRKKKSQKAKAVQAKTTGKKNIKQSSAARRGTLYLPFLD
jgi:hypothetical protein